MKTNQYESSKRARDKYRARHKERLNRLQRERYKHDPEKAKKNKLRYLYGITPEYFMMMKFAQNDCCKICAQKVNKLVVDHCHTTKKVRGLLCVKCNAGIGMFEDEVIRLARAIEYLNNTI